MPFTSIILNLLSLLKGYRFDVQILPSSNGFSTTPLYTEKKKNIYFFFINVLLINLIWCTIYGLLSLIMTQTNLCMINLLYLVIKKKFNNLFKNNSKWPNNIKFLSCR